MRVAAFYDVHGNAPALAAVLAELGEVDAVVFGGDLIWGAWPRETLDLALGLGDRAHFIMGNTDRGALTDEEDPSGFWVRERLRSDEQAFVMSWPTTLTLDGALYCHGTPRSDTEVVTPFSPEERWSEVLDGVDEEIVVCGHTHLQYDERHADRRVVNPGSIGLPTLRATAWWAILDDGEPELRTTDYDTRATANAWRASGYPRADLGEQLLKPTSLDELRAAIG